MHINLHLNIDHLNTVNTTADFIVQYFELHCYKEKTQNDHKKNIKYLNILLEKELREPERNDRKAKMENYKIT